MKSQPAGIAASALAMLLALATASAAEFTEGADAYARKDYARARAVFRDLAELGDAVSQYDLGAMALRGEGAAAPDRGEAAGWMLAARENGHDPTPRKLDELRASLGEGERAAADAILARFGRAALEANVLPRGVRGEQGARRWTPPRYLGGGDPEYPSRAEASGEQGVVVVRTVVAVDGRIRDPEVVLSIPPRSRGGAPFVDAVMRSILSRRYAPATIDGKPIAVTYTFQVSFRAASASAILKQDLVTQTLFAAGAGDPRAQFVAGLLGMTPRCASDACTHVRDPAGLILAAAQSGVPEAQLFVGRQLSRARETAKALVWLERASRAGLDAAHAAYGLELLGTAEPPYEKIRALLSRAAASDEPFAIRRAIAALACSPDPRLRSPADAVALSRRIDVSAEPDPLTVEAVAAARAAAGDFDGAHDAERRAIRAARKVQWDTAPMEKRLEAYAAGRPCTGELVPEGAEERLFGSPAP